MAAKKTQATLVVQSEQQAPEDAAFPHAVQSPYRAGWEHTLTEKYGRRGKAWSAPTCSARACRSVKLRPPLKETATETELATAGRNRSGSRCHGAAGPRADRVPIRQPAFDTRYGTSRRAWGNHRRTADLHLAFSFPKALITDPSDSAASPTQILLEAGLRLYGERSIPTR